MEISNMGDTHIKPAKRKLDYTSNVTGYSHFREGLSPSGKESSQADGPMVLSKGESTFKPTDRWYKRRKWRIFLGVSSKLRRIEKISPQACH
jgi:hypothetical protein